MENENTYPISDLYENYTETQKEILQIELKKTRTNLFTIALVIFAFDFFALALANLLVLNALLIICVVPLVMTGLAFLSMKEPLLAMILAATIILGIWVYIMIQAGVQAGMMGWFSKAIIVYLVIAGFQNATEAQRIKKELKQ